MRPSSWGDNFYMMSLAVIDSFLFLPGFAERVWLPFEDPGVIDGLDCADPLAVFRTIVERASGQMVNHGTLISHARDCGIARARSVSKSTCVVAIATAAVLKRLQDRSLSESVQRALLVCSQSSAGSIAYQVDRVGLGESWSLVDPFGLPNAIPSATATSCFAALKLRGIACAFPGGLESFFGALEHAQLLLSAGVVRQAIVVHTEEYSEYHSHMESTSAGEVFQNIAAGLVLEATSKASQAPVLTSLSKTSNVGVTVGGRCSSPAEAAYDFRLRQHHMGDMFAASVMLSLLPRLKIAEKASFEFAIPDRATSFNFRVELPHRRDQL